MATTPPTLDDLQARLNEINAAIASPERQVTLGSQNITLRSIDDLNKARLRIEADINNLNAATDPVPRVKRIFGTYSGRGFNDGC
jgi:hypothetical protein